MNSGAVTGRDSLRVCHLAYTFYEYDNRVIRYVDALSERGDQVDVIALRRQRHPWREAIKHGQLYSIQRRSMKEKREWVYLLKLLWFFVKASVLLTWLQLRRRYHVVHVHNIPDFLAFAAIVPKMMGARVILDIHDLVPELYADKFSAKSGSNRLRLLLLIEKLSCRFADHVIVANHLWRDRLVKRSAPSAKCTAMMNYPDLRRFRPSSEGATGRCGKFVMLYPGSLSHHQGLDIAIRAVALVAGRMPAAELHIYGEGPTRDGLVALAHDRGVADRVRFMDAVPLDEIPAVIASASVGIVPKRSEGFGGEAFSTKILEFMACGVPVIVSRTRVDAHYFDDTLVRFFASGDEVDLGQAMLHAYEHRLEHGAWIRRGLDFAKNNSWQAKGGRYRDLVDSLSAEVY